MPHVRQQIRQQAQTALAGAELAVIDSPADSIGPEQLPCVIVRTSGEVADLDQETLEGVQNRTLAVFVDCVVGRVVDASDELDELVLAAEKALQPLPNFQLESTAIDFVTKAERPFAIARLEYRTTYQTLASAPDERL
jgi:hypothetical protein